MNKSIEGYLRGVSMDKKYYAGQDIMDAIIGLMEDVGSIKGADVVEVVRCKDCRFCMEFKNKRDGFYGHCRILITCTISDYAALVDADGYCSYGERKEGEG